MDAYTYLPRTTTTRKTLRHGQHWVELKDDLCAADLMAGAKALQEHGFQAYRIARVAAWLVSWSLPAPLGETDAAKAAAVGALSVPGFNEIAQLVDAHDKTTEQTVSDQGDPSSPAGAPRSEPDSEPGLSPSA